MHITNSYIKSKLKMNPSFNFLENSINAGKYVSISCNIGCQMKPEPVPSTFAFSSSIRLTSSKVVLGLLNISSSLMKTTDGEASYNNSKITLPAKQSIQACRAKMKIKKTYN